MSNFALTVGDNVTIGETYRLERSDAEREGVVHCVYTDGTCLVRLKNGGYARPYEEELLPLGDYSLTDDAKLTPIIFFGNGKFAANLLTGLVKKGFMIVGVVTTSCWEGYRGHKSSSTPVKKIAEKYNIPTATGDNLGSVEFSEWLSLRKGEIGVMADFRIIPECVIKAFTYGVVNLHQSILPEYRGSSPIRGAIMNNERTTGLTAFVVNPYVDRGDLLCNLAFDIKGKDTAGDVLTTMNRHSADVVETALIRYISGKKPFPQYNLSDGLFAPSMTYKIKHSDRRIDWSEPREKILAFIRAHVPSPAAWTTLFPLDGDNPVRVLIYGASRSCEGSDKPVGYMWNTDGRLYVKTAHGTIRITDMAAFDKPIKPAAYYLAGYSEKFIGRCK